MIFPIKKKPIKAALNALALTAGIVVSSLAQAGKPVVVGDMAPEYSFKTIAGQSIQSKQLKGDKPIYMKFWATWCSYCTEEMPHTQATFEKYGDQLEVVAMNVGMNDSVNKINHFFKKNDYSIPVYFDAKGDLTAMFGITGTPQHILIDKTGKVIHRSSLLTDDLEEKIKQAIGVTQELEEESI